MRHHAVETSLMTPKKRQFLLQALAELYPDPHSELDFTNEYQLLIAVMLSAQCTDKKVNQVTPELFTAYPTFKALSEAKLSDVERIIRPINYYKTKSKNLIATGKEAVEHFQSKVPDTHDELTSLPGVGNKTANVILSEKGVVPAFPVDTHIFRLAHRLGLSSGKNPDAVEKDLRKAFPSSEWRNLHHRLIFHGRRVCSARSPQCGGCVLRKLCPSAD
jgi:endonuclease-3